MRATRRSLIWESVGRSRLSSWSFTQSFLPVRAHMDELKKSFSYLNYPYSPQCQCVASYPFDLLLLLTSYSFRLTSCVPDHRRSPSTSSSHRPLSLGISSSAFGESLRFSPSYVRVPCPHTRVLSTLICASNARVSRSNMQAYIYHEFPFPPPPPLGTNPLTKMT